MKNKNKQKNVVILEKVLERDIDLLLMNQLINNNKFLCFLTTKVGIAKCELISIEHSHMDSELGESDIRLIVQSNNYKIGILIENKIDALAMPEQPERYKKRGDKGIKEGDFDYYHIFIIAPRQYLDNNLKAQEYPNKVSYEELLDFFTGDDFVISVLQKAIEIKENGYYTVVEDEAVTVFWSEYYKFIRKYYPQIKIRKTVGPRGSRASWPILLTSYPNITIKHKSDRGFLDLTFYQMANHIKTFYKYTNEVIEKDFEVVKTGGSLSIRLHIPIIDFKAEFDNYINEMHIIMKSALKLYNLLKKINVLMMYEEIKPLTYQINNIEDFINYYPNGIIVNYDSRVTYRCSTAIRAKTDNKLKPKEAIGDNVHYPFIQPYQTGIKPNTKLFIILNNELYKLERIITSENEIYYQKIEFDKSISEEFYQDEAFKKENYREPVLVGSEQLLEIVEN